ncbi:MAG TPA: ATP synthase F1 subunit delta [Thermoanaerobaculia bacterium]|nr:ATP synthase F1 subunit delta [Thermoanaerobaculia bacterium]
MRTLARPYAEALLGAAGSTDRAVAVRDQLVAFARLLADHPVLGRMATSPAVPLAVKQQALAAVAESAGLDPLARRFLAALLTRYRLRRLEEILAGVGELIDHRLGIAIAEVGTAQPLSDEQRSRLAAALQGKLGRKVRLEESTDPDLLAGFRVRVGSDLWDASLRGQLDRLERELLHAQRR